MARIPFPPPRGWILCTVACLAAGPACVPTREPARPRLHYRVEIDPGKPFRVELRAEGVSRRVSFRLLDGWGVLQGMAAHVRDVRAVDARGVELPVTLATADGEARWEVPGFRGGEVTLRYAVDPYDPLLSPEASFANTSRFLFLGYSLFLLPRRTGFFEPADVRVEIAAPGPIWSSWPRAGGEFAPETPHDLWSGVVAGGMWEAIPLGVNPVSVTVLTEGRGQRSTGTAIANRLLPVLREIETYFGGPPRADSLHVLAVYRLLPEDAVMSMMTGTSEEGAFLCLATPDRFHAVEPLTVLAAHECLHFYLGGAITAEPEPPYRNTPDLAWFVEGLTEYLSYALMVRAGVLAQADVALATDLKYRDYRRSPGALSVADAARRMEDVATYRLVYTRGYLAARLLDREMTEKGGPDALRDALRDVLRRNNAYHGGRAVTGPGVKDIFEAHVPGVHRVIERYAEGNEPLPEPRAGEPAGTFTARR